ncbi:MAG: hypothetical protein FWH22_10625 [Fibromonadales bacterium]|nr:hypothetical protein [Fibromonadales bacterium]
MEVVLNMLNEENLRTLVILVAMVCGFIWLNTQFDKKMDKKLEDFHVKLKTNDFAHLNASIEALTYVLKKNNLIDSDDANFIGSKLDK